MKIKVGDTFYAVLKKDRLGRTKSIIDGHECIGVVHGPFICTEFTSACVQSEERKFNTVNWSIRKPSRKLLEQSCTEHGESV